jgi:histidine ammonia-lyase
MLGFLRGVLQIEINSATDNPLVFPEDGSVLSGGNFHGQPLATALDAAAIAVASVGAMSERRVERLLNPHLSGLPAFLAQESGLHSGYMLAQYTAAALVSENKVLCHPASVDSIPTSANQEDFVSMGAHAARKALQILRNVQHVVAIELLVAAQAVDLDSSGKLGRGTRAVYEAVRAAVPMLREDRVLAEDLRQMTEWVRRGTLAERVEKVLVR